MERFQETFIQNLLAAVFWKIAQLNKACANIYFNIFSDLAMYYDKQKHFYISFSVQIQNLKNSGKKAKKILNPIFYLEDMLYFTFL